MLLTSDKNGKVKRGSSVVRHLPLVLEVPGFDPCSWRGKFRCLNTLSLVSFAGMTLDKCIVWIGSSSSSSFSALRLLCHFGKVYLHKFNVGMATQVRLLHLVVTLTVCPLCRESHPLCRLKNPTVISIWSLVGFHPATRSVQSTPADNTRKRVWQYIEKERKKGF